MMGFKDRSFAPLRDVSLEEMVPKDNPYRRLEAALDLSFVRDLVRPLYAGGGRPSVDPVVFFKLQLVMFFEDLRSERQLMRVVGDRLSLRWYLGYDLHEPLPDHSSLTRIRECYGLEIFRSFFERIVEECVQAGLVRGDSVYGTLPNVKAVERAGIRAFMPIIDYTRGKRLFRKDEFAYDPEADVYTCPAGEILKKDGVRFKQEITRYIAAPETCAACALKSRCTGGKSGRAVARSFDEEYYDRVRSYRGTSPYEKALRKRKVWIEPLFAEAKEWHGMREVRLRTLERVNAEVLMVASGQNVKRLLEFGDRKPRKAAQAAALRPPGRSGLRPCSGRHVAQRCVFQRDPRKGLPVGRPLRSRCAYRALRRGLEGGSAFRAETGLIAPGR